MNNTRRQQFQMPKASSIYAGGLADPQGCRSFDQSGFAATLLSTTNLVKLVAINSHATTCPSRTISSKPKADLHFLPYHAQQWSQMEPSTWSQDSMSTNSCTVGANQLEPPGYLRIEIDVTPCFPPPWSGWCLDDPSFSSHLEPMSYGVANPTWLFKFKGKRW